MHLDSTETEQWKLCIWYFSGILPCVLLLLADFNLYVFPIINCNHKYNGFQGVLWVPSSKSKLRVVLATPGICSSFQKWRWSWGWCPFVVGLTLHTPLLNRIHLKEEVKKYYFIIYNFLKSIWGKERINVCVWWRSYVFLELS